MPIDKSKYPDNWDEISLQVRTAAHWQCEWCEAPNLSIIQRIPHKRPRDWIEVVVVPSPIGSLDTRYLNWKQLRQYGLTKVVLTVAHIDRNSRNNEMDNLAALCQRCHLRHDILQHIAARRYGRDHKEPHQLKLEI